MEKIKELEKILKSYKKVAIAFSGGLDSSFLLYVSKKFLGKENIMAITIYSPYKISEKDFEETKKIAKELDIKQKIVEVDLPEEIKNNPIDRCYFCKKQIFSHLVELIKSEGFNVLCDGTNADDLNDYRPGMKAAKEIGVESPLLLANFTKKDIRYYAKKWKLYFWNKPSNACLISRLPNNTEINLNIIQKIAKAEEYLKELGFKIVRVRYHNELARIEIGEKEFKKILNKKLLSRIDAKIKEIGFKYVALDCKGYKMGNMNG